MYVHRVNNGKRIPQFTCSAYSKQPVGTRCPTQHRINADVVLTLIRETLREIIQFSKDDEEVFIQIVQKAVSEHLDVEQNTKVVRLDECQKRVEELEILLCKIYEDNALGKLPTSRFSVMNDQYSEEQEKRKKEIRQLKEALGGNCNKEKSASKFIALVKKYQSFEELTTPMLIEFVDKILVHERAIKGRPDSPQEIEIYFNFIGQFSVREEVKPTPEELAEEQKKEKIRKQRHEAYLRRKESGWQDAYYQKTKAAKKEKLDAAKNAIRAEDIANGVFIPGSEIPRFEAKEGEAAV